VRLARAARPAIAAALAAALAGCGLGPGPGTSDANLKVTRDFGSASVGQFTQNRVPGAETVMQMLQRSFKVDTRYGGGFVQSIDSFTGASPRQDWFYYVNGIEAPQGAATTAVHKGDRVWWDLHDWQVTDSVPAVVGSFPEPFVHGTEGKRLPTVLDCAPDVKAACNRVAAAMKAAGVPVAGQQLGGGSGSDSLALLVGTWQDLHGVIATELLDAGPTKSGVYARFVGGGGQALELLDPRGGVLRTLHQGAGLVAATEQPTLSEPTWMITGTDQAGVDAAAAALTPARLRNHFALAVAGKQDLPLPLLPGQ
jgi:Domain of unknown function (DUF4430)